MTKQEKLAKARKIQKNAAAMRAIGADDDAIIKALKNVLLVRIDVNALLSAKTDSELMKTLAPWFKTIARIGDN